MPGRTRIELGGIVLGVVFIALGSLVVVFPSAQVVPHHDPETGKYSLERLSENGSRVYGMLAVIVGAGLVWFSRWPARGAKNSAIECYVWELSQELARRFGLKRYYMVEEVTKSAQRAGFSIAFLAYAHAMFCSRVEFDAHYGPLHVACTYDGLRAIVAHKYFGGAADFDAAAIVRATERSNDEEYSFHDSGLA
jgi:hypothetical protein